MTIRHNQHRIERRRRIRVDEPSPARQAESQADEQREVGKVVYSNSARVEEQPRITNLLPVRARSLAIWFLAGAVAVAVQSLLVASYTIWWADRWLPFAPLWDGSRTTSVTNWLVSMFLLVATVYSVLIWWIRRHRLDDYRGRYRVWPLLTCLFLFASFDWAVGVRSTVIDELASVMPAESASLWVRGTIAVALTATILRMAIEVRSSVGSLLWLSSAASCFMIIGLIQVGAITLRSELYQVASDLLALVGTWLLTLATITYGRYVFLDAQGLIRHRLPSEQNQETKRREKKKRSAKSEEAAASSASAPERSKGTEDSDLDAERSTQRTANRKPASLTQDSARDAQRSTNSPSTNSPSTTVEDIDDHQLGDESERRMSKAERRKARKAKRKQRQAA